MRAGDAQNYHGGQIGALPRRWRDLFSALTMTNIGEAVGIVWAARRRPPVAFSFTLETDGRLPTGESLGQAIEAVDRATVSGSGLFHDQLRASRPFRDLLDEGEDWTRRARDPGERFSNEPCGARQCHELDDGSIRWSSARNTRPAAPLSRS